MDGHTIHKLGAILPNGRGILWACGRPCPISGEDPKWCSGAGHSLKSATLLEYEAPVKGFSIVQHSLV